MDLRELRAFVAAAHELHFTRAAATLFMSPSTMTELIHRLEVELGAPLFIRTTRRIALTDAGVELLGRAEAILDMAVQASEAVGAIARGDIGVVRLGVTPPAAPVIAPYLARCFTVSGLERSVDIQRMWLPQLGAALRAGTVDAALTCGDLGIADPDITSVEICAERLLIGLRAGHTLAASESIDLHQLSTQTLGMHPAHLFPAWHAVQQQILDAANVAPPIVEIDDTDLTARRWMLQPEIEWVLLIASLLAGDEATVVVPAREYTVPFTLSWHATPTIRPVLKRFVDSCLGAVPPEGWISASSEGR